MPDWLPCCWQCTHITIFIALPSNSAGIPDLLQLVVKLTQSLMVERLMFVNNLEVRGGSLITRVGFAVWGFDPVMPVGGADRAPHACE